MFCVRLHKIHSQMLVSPSEPRWIWLVTARFAHSETALCGPVLFSPRVISVLIHSVWAETPQINRSRRQNCRRQAYTKPSLWLPSLTLFLSKKWGKPWGSFIHPICITPRVGVHLTDGHPDLNYNQVIQWEEGQLIIDGHVICIKVHAAVKTPIACDICLQFTLSRNAQCQNHRVTRQQALKKKEKMIHKHYREAVHSSCAICFFINTAALSAVNTLCISLFLFARQCSVAASGACLQSNRLSPLFLCFLSVLSDRRQGWGMSATSSCTGACRLLMLVSPGTCKSCHFSSQSQNFGCQNTEAEVIFKTFDHNLNKFQFVIII